MTVSLREARDYVGQKKMERNMKVYVPLRIYQGLIEEVARLRNRVYELEERHGMRQPADPPRDMFSDGCGGWIP